MLTRRNLLRSATASVPVAAAGIIHWPTASWAQTGSKTFVLAHGSWHGGWCWKKVADRLRAKGHTVYTPSYTGMGERAHLLSRDITINTFAEDLVQLIQSEELSNVILVGHTSAVFQFPERPTAFLRRSRISSISIPFWSRAEGARSPIIRRQRLRGASRQLRRQLTA